ncbi:MAG TPA: hypothetical protein VFC67_26265, partial [Prolixibacteraceae bacterium]|nr:hypothetical protein [Prolixibacteraceae bacterium]
MTDIKNENLREVAKVESTIAPWLSVGNSVTAIAFYKSAFGAVELYRMEDPDGGLVVKLSVKSAEFWLSGGSNDDANLSSEPLGG